MSRVAPLHDQHVRTPVQSRQLFAGRGTVQWTGECVGSEGGREGVRTCVCEGGRERGREGGREGEGKEIALSE